MSDIAIRVDHLSKLYPVVAPRARHLGRAQSRAGDSVRSQRHDTLRDALRGYTAPAVCAGVHRAEIDRKFDEIAAFAEIERFLDATHRSNATPAIRPWRVRLEFAVAVGDLPENLFALD